MALSIFRRGFMTATIKSIPDGYHSVTPMLAIKDATSAIEFYKQAFGATELNRLTEPSGKIAHAEILIGDSRIMIADEYPEYNLSPQTLGASTVIIHIYVEDVDTAVDGATAAGAKVRYPVEDQFYGDRSATLVDPFGHIWMIATHKEDVSSEEIEKRFVAFCGKS
jgi:PhnB protein